MNVVSETLLESPALVEALRQGGVLIENSLDAGLPSFEEATRFSNGRAGPSSSSSASTSESDVTNSTAIPSPPGQCHALYIIAA